MPDKGLTDQQPTSDEPTPMMFTCRDGYRLHGHIWYRDGCDLGTVIVNPATGVLAQYYHRYARFLMEQGFVAISYDYRGIGASRPTRLRGSVIRWRDWGELDFDAVAKWARDRDPLRQLAVVGHSIGGFLPGFAESAVHVDRMLTVGSQYAYWRDYESSKRVALFWKWHLIMPILTRIFGYFPGRRLGWVEDLPAEVANEWSTRRARMELSYPADQRAAILNRFAAVKAKILAVGLSDDEFGTPLAIRRALRYYKHCERSQVLLKPRDLGFESIGHFGLFHSRHRDGFWSKTCFWLKDGINPWPAPTLS